MLGEWKTISMAKWVEQEIFTALSYKILLALVPFLASCQFLNASYSQYTNSNALP